MISSGVGGAALVLGALAGAGCESSAPTGDIVGAWRNDEAGAVLVVGPELLGTYTTTVGVTPADFGQTEVEPQILDVRVERDAFDAYTLVIPPQTSLIGDHEGIEVTGEDLLCTSCWVEGDRLECDRAPFEVIGVGPLGGSCRFSRTQQPQGLP